jgi:hypothetical protein
MAAWYVSSAASCGASYRCNLEAFLPLISTALEERNEGHTLRTKLPLQTSNELGLLAFMMGLGGAASQLAEKWIGKGTASAVPLPAKKNAGF